MTLALLVPLLALGQQGRVIDVDEAVRLSLQSSPGLKSVHLRREAAEAQADSIRGRMGPLIALSEEWQRYDSPFAIQFGPSTFVARNVITNTFAASATQPLLGLFRTYQEKVSANSSALAADEIGRSYEAAVREQVETAYLHYFEAKAAEDIAATSQKQLEEQATLIDARLKAGTVTTADRLRLDVAISKAKLQRIQAQATESTVRTALLLAMGLEGEANVDFKQPTELEQRPLSAMNEADARAEAARARPEVMRAVRDEESAQHHAKASYLALLPDLGAEAAYSNLQGQVFAPHNQFYIGLKAQWAVWEWGATYNAAKAADKNADAAAEAVEDQKLQVKNEASSRWVQARAAASAIEAAQTTIASAEEAYRVEQALVSAGSATTTDLLQAQSELTEAKLNLVQARYEQALALVALQRALGTSAPAAAN